VSQNTWAPYDPFGSYLASVAERDIDFLLMEEFHASDDFVAWLCAELHLDGVTAAGAWHSVSDADGESDLVLCVLQHGRRIGVLIENKVSAPEQNRQGERYHLRGRRLRDQGKLDDYRTVICAPDRYLCALSADSTYQHRVSYERIADWFSRQEGRRAKWRHRVISEAIDQGRRGYTMIVNETITRFHQEYWKYLQSRHPRIQMAPPKGRGSHSNWIILKGDDFPNGVSLSHKFDQQVMEIGFAERKIVDILAVKPEWPDDIAVVQKGKTASLAITVPAIDMNVGLESQLPAMEIALGAAYRLMPYASLLNPPS
jgi:hypothetical protein